MVYRLVVRLTLITMLWFFHNFRYTKDYQLCGSTNEQKLNKLNEQCGSVLSVLFHFIAEKALNGQGFSLCLLYDYVTSDI